MLIFLAMMPGVALAQTVKRSFSLGISVAQTTVKLGSPAIVKIELKKTSDHDISWMSLPGWDVHGEVIGFPPIVRDAQGNEPPLTRWGRQVFARPAPGEPTRVIGNDVGLNALHPGEVLKTEIKLHEMYDLSVPGKYTVQVRYYDDEHKEEVKSNIITITVTP